MKMQAEAAVVRLQVKEHKGLPAARGEAGKEFRSRAPGGGGGRCPELDFWAPKL